MLLSVNQISNATMNDVNMSHLLTKIKFLCLKIKNIKKWLKVYKKDSALINKVIYYSNNETVQQLLNKYSIEKWKDVAISNNALEMSYDFSGGQQIKTISNENFESINLESFVDESYDKSPLGRDIDFDFLFKNDDINVLNEDLTLIQSFNTLLNLKKSDNYYIKQIGVQKDIIGNSQFMLSIPVIFRQISETFSIDDAFNSVILLDINRVDDNLYIEIGATTILGDLIKRSIQA